MLGKFSSGPFCALVVLLFLSCNVVAAPSVKLKQAGEGRRMLSWSSDVSCRLEIYATTNLISPQWEIAFTNIVTGSETNCLLEGFNESQEYVVVVNADLDSDGDLLADAREIYLYKTKAGDHDSDGDGLLDGWEILHELNPLSGLMVDGGLGDFDSDGFSNLEEQAKGTAPDIPNQGGSTGAVATIRYYYDEDDRLTDFFVGKEEAQKTVLTDAHNIKEEISVK